MTDAVPKFKASRMLCWSVLLLSGIIYGSSFSWMKIAVNGGADPLGMVFWFSLIATFFLAAVMTIRGKLRYFEAKYLQFCIPWAVLSVIIPNLLFFYAATKVQPSIIAIGIALVPILTLLGATLLRRETLTVRRAAGIALGAAGIGMILLPRASLPDANDTVFILIAFAGAACYAVEHLYIEVKLPQEITIDRLLLLMFFSATIMLIPAVFLTNTFFAPSWPLGPTELAIVGLASVTLLDYFFITLLIVWAGPVFTSQAAYVVTLAGVVWGIVIFDDELSMWLWGALAVLMFGLILVRPREHHTN